MTISQQLTKASLSRLLMSNKHYNVEIAELKIEQGLALQDILTEIHHFIHRIEFPSHIKMVLLDNMGIIEYHLASGTSEKIQLGALIGAFQSVRNEVVNQQLASN
jgi:replication factor C subunit 3/5